MKIIDRFHSEKRIPIFPERFLIGIRIAILYWGSGEKLIPKKWYPPCANPAPRGAHGTCDASVLPVRDTLRHFL